MAKLIAGQPMDLVTLSKLEAKVGQVVETMLTVAQFESENLGQWMLMNGQTCSGTAFEAITGKTTVPDMATEGTFLRQAKLGRELGSYEADAQQNITGAFAFTDDNATNYRHRVAHVSGSFGAYHSTTNALSASGGGVANGVSTDVNFDSSRQVRTAPEVRSKNIAVNFFIKVGY